MVGSQAKAASAGSRRPLAPLHVLAGPGCVAVIKYCSGVYLGTTDTDASGDSGLGTERTGRYNCDDSGLIAAGGGAAGAIGSGLCYCGFC